jgi:DNA (cytosine-5)-methyltransferase 1
VLRPKAIVMENVTGLATMSKGDVLREIGRAFDASGYTVSCAELLAAQYGVPQMRWRMIFIGWRKEDYGHLNHCGFPQPSHGRSGIGALLPNRTITRDESADFVTAKAAIGDLPPVAAGGFATVYQKKPKGAYQLAMRHGLAAELFNHYAPAISELNLARIRSLKPGQDWRHMPRELLPGGMQRALRKDHTRRYRRMTWAGVPRAIITKFRDPKSGEYTHPDQDRTITIREAARIQSLPDWFVLCGSYSDQYEQVGNAVPPLLARAVGLEIRKALLGQVTSAKPPTCRYRIPAEQDSLFPQTADDAEPVAPVMD